MSGEITRTIEPASDEPGVWVVEHDSYPEGSVLEGRDRRSLVKYYPTREEASSDYPDAEVLDWSTKNPYPEELSYLPPAWFDPQDAGEIWSELDY